MQTSNASFGSLARNLLLRRAVIRRQAEAIVHQAVGLQLADHVDDFLRVNQLGAERVVLVERPAAVEPEDADRAVVRQQLA